MHMHEVDLGREYIGGPGHCHETPVCVVIGIFSGTSSILPVGVIMCTWVGEHNKDAFSDLSTAVQG